MQVSSARKQPQYRDPWCPRPQKDAQNRKASRSVNPPLGVSILPPSTPRSPITSMLSRHVKSLETPEMVPASILDREQASECIM